MKYESEIKTLLIENAIHIISEGGFEKATTRELTHCSGSRPDLKMNEVYIYRFFGSKEELYQEVFAKLDRELCSAFLNALAETGDFDGKTKEKLQGLFGRAWRYIIKNEERCRCYVRYYHSAYFKGSSQKDHDKRFSEIVSAMAPLFRGDADVISIWHSVYTALLDFAVRVYNGDLENSEENQSHIFNVLYCMMVTYLQHPDEKTLPDVSCKKGRSHG